LYEAATGKLNGIGRIQPNTKCSRKETGGIKRRRGKQSLKIKKKNSRTRRYTNITTQILGEECNNLPNRHV